MQLSEHKTYRTRDGSRTGIRVEPRYGAWHDISSNNGTGRTPTLWKDNGEHLLNAHHFDLIEETLASDPQPFSYDACPVGEDGRKRAVTRGGREVVLSSDQGVAGAVIGWLSSQSVIRQWHADGRLQTAQETDYDLLIPPPPKRVVWVNLYEMEHSKIAAEVYAYATEAEADAGTIHSRLGNRAYPIEVE